MHWSVTIHPRTLHFKEPAGTSRGVYLVHDVWYVALQGEEGHFGVGESAPLPDLSCDAGPGYAARLEAACRAFGRSGDLDAAVPPDAPSIRFGLETALAHAKAGSVRLFDTPFGRGERDIPINGLIWMGSHEQMLARLEAKMAQGFRCIKFKIGAIDFDLECDLIRRIRERYPDPKELEIRLDANGGFTPENAPARLERLAAFRPHSIEQPVRQGQWEEMGKLCRESPIPIALDEELIGVHETARKEALLDAIRPAYVILKPSLHGGMKGCDEWIALASSRGIGHWATSALESNIGLNAIAHWCATRDPAMPQGLGTGQLFTDNMEGYPLSIRRCALHFDAGAPEPDLAAWLGLER